MNRLVIKFTRGSVHFESDVQNADAIEWRAKLKLAPGCSPFLHGIFLVNENKPPNTPATV